MSFLDQLRGRDAAAMERARRIVARAPDDPEAQSLLAELAVTTHAADAEEVLQPLARAGPDTRPQWFLPESFRALYAWTLAERGQRARADSLWDEALAQDRRDLANGHDAPNRPMEIAAINAIRGDTASALEWLERGYRAGFKDYRLLARDPFFDGLRAHPRYQQIVARMKEDVGAMRRRAVAAHDTLFAPRRAQ